MFSTPVLFIVFNRPDATLATFNAIREARPSALYIAADGPRQEREDDLKNCAEVRSLVKNIDWECRVQYLFRDKNLGCKISVSTAIDWFFENETEGIILEDDCLPNPSFFIFCQQLLDKYRDDKRVMTICGRNPMGETDIASSYLFSRFNKEWGWASWRRAWQMHDIEKTCFDLAVTEGVFKRVFDDPEICKYLHDVNKSVQYDGHVSWAYPWQFNIISQNGLAVVPAYNLVTNIGLNSGTHFDVGSNVNRDVFNIKTYTIPFPLKHPAFVFPDMKYDTACFYVVHPYLLPKKYTTLDRMKDSFKYRFNKLLGRA